MNSNKFLKTMRIALIVFALTFSSNIHAATPVAFGSGFWNWIKSLFGGGHHGGGHHGGGHQGGDAVPLDGGLGILVLGAAAFGVKKLRESKNEEA
ncbi:MAG: PID-CTERM protein-sorting domain-containing protein [Flavobacteriales bacterium]